jgi:CubicO group peptidase (beta-lactamase class C family)
MSDQLTTDRRTLWHLSEQQLGRISGFIENLVAADRIVGAVLYMQRGGGEVVMHRAFGWSDREQGRSMTPDTIFRVRSMTKPLVGTAALMLLEQGKLSLEDRICRYLPSFDRAPVRDITVLHLLTHTSGLTGAIYDTIGGTSFTSLREAVDYLGSHSTLAFEPGSSYEYSDPGSSTLGALVTEVAGMPCEDFITQRILSPLGMTDSFCTLVDQDDPRRSRIASTYRGQDGDWSKYWDPAQEQLLRFFRASGGLYSTATDYARFVTAILRGGSAEHVRLLSPETVRQALIPRASRQPIGASSGDPQEFYGLHWTIYGSFYGEVGEGTFGHGGSDGTIAVADPARDLVVLYMTQSRGTTTRPEVIRLIFGEVARAEAAARQ